MRYYFLIYFFCLFSCSVRAQEFKAVYSYATINDSLLWQKSGKEVFNNEEKLLKHLQERQEFFQNKGYLLFSIDTLQIDSNVVKVKIDFNRKFSSLKLNVSQLHNDLLKKAGYLLNDEYLIVISPSEFISFKSKILSLAAEEGYPFAKIAFIDNKIEQNQITGTCIFKPGSKIFFDTLSISGDVNISNDFLVHYLGLKKSSGELVPFNQKTIDNIEGEIHKLSYISLLQEPNVLFKDDKAIVCISLKAKKSNQIDGMLGVLPSTSTNNKASLNGYLNLNLYNPLGKGKQIGLKWQRVKRLSPTYQMLYYHPQLFKSNLDLEFNFFSLQQDSIFRNMQWSVGISKQISVRKKIGFYFKRVSGINLARINNINLNIPLGNSKFIANLMGISYEVDFTDEINYTKKGWYASIKAEFGNRNLISTFNDTTENQNSNRILGIFEFKKFLPLTKFFTFVSQTSFGWMNGQKVYNYELYRLGGINSLRGFDENFFYTPLYLLNRFDIQFKLDKYSNFFIFNDFASLKRNNSINLDTEVIFPYSFGTGLNIKVKQGHLTLAMALGSSRRSLTSSKARFHFGYTAIF